MLVPKSRCHACTSKEPLYNQTIHMCSLSLCAVCSVQCAACSRLHVSRSTKPNKACKVNLLHPLAIPILRPQPFSSPLFRPASPTDILLSSTMVSSLPATSSPVWPVDKFVEVPSVPLPPSSNTLQLFNSPSLQPSTPSSHALPSTPPLPSSTATADATDQQWGQPTISTFSTSASLHIVQPYLQNESDPAHPVKESNLPSDVLNQSATRPRRPANAWILYRSHKMKNLKPTEPSAPRRTQADISKLIAEMWKNETEEVKKYYETLSDLAKVEHHAQYPTYRFQPAKKAEKSRGQKKARKAERRAERGTNAHVVPSPCTPLLKRSANSQLEWHSMDDTLSSQRTLYPQKTVPARLCATVFVPYEVPLRPRSSVTRKTKRSTRPQASEESQGWRPSLSSQVTTLSMSPTTSEMPNEAVSSEAPTHSLNRWPEQSTPLTTIIQRNAHSDHSHAYNSLTTVCLLHSTPTTGRSLTDPICRPITSSLLLPDGHRPPRVTNIPLTPRSP